MPLKSLLGLGVVYIGWQLFVEQMGKDSFFWLHRVKDAIKVFQSGT
jgi:hypothetical protein